ncbi:hypothetical protein C499_02424 [Halogeometricum borinquense DSM 11551]|uniref:Uncharacterized protein n=2 Tax=Halogeometricum borinquense TaxID=60847 RepID=E4NPU2_HALBP|nr:hypothetical protein [Halogeometricum borinquense]ADQ66575.1 hypothetical protein Hbor_09810 [Halogeometricum borinquense DSM 11551]ELY30683.1 hypothetical protein C499_02424 [Halogeometricum borinquense DSM 11551]RYJ14433.1 hypothetical protein ELS19_11020 [Halogeometricum borinquense]
MTIAVLSTVTTALTVVVGVFVASLAYRGYRRNDSETMRALVVGIVLIAVVPGLATTGLPAVVEVNDAGVLLVALLSHTLGLVAIYRSLD